MTLSPAAAQAVLIDLPLTPDLAARAAAAFPGYAPFTRVHDLRALAEAPADALLAALAPGSPEAPAAGAILDTEGDMQALSVLRRIPWESAQLGIPSGALSPVLAQSPQAAAAVARRLEQWAVSQHIALLSARVQAEETAAAQGLEAAGWQVVDTILEFWWDLAGWTAPTGGDWTVRPALPSDQQPMADLAATAFTDSSAIRTRYTADPRLNRERVADLYRAWLLESFAGTFADAVLIAEAAGRPVGFVAMKLEHPVHTMTVGRITLNAVAPEARNRGAYTAALAGALQWCRDQGAGHARLLTQATTYPVHRVCQRLGGRVASAHLTFHRWTDAS